MRAQRTGSSILGRRIIRDLTLALLGCFLLVSGTTSFYVARQAAEKEATLEARRLGAVLQQYLNVPLDTAIALGPVFSRYAALDRNEALTSLREVTKSRSQFLGSYVVFEPNAYDGNDEKWKNKDAHDATGRFIPYVVKSKDKIIFQANVDYEKEGAGDYYIVPRRTLKDYVVEPYEYTIDGKSVLLTSFVHALKRNDHFIGITGIDIALDQLQKDVAEMRPGGSGRVTVLSHNAKVVASGLDGVKTGQTAAELGLSTETAEKVKRGLEFSESGASSLSVFVPVRIGEQAWSAQVTYPQSAIISRSFGDLAINLAAVLIALGVAVLFLVRVVRARISLPLGEAREIAQEIAAGNVNVKSTMKTAKDEVGDLLAALNSMAGTLSGIISQIRSDSKETLDVSHRLAQASQTLSSGTEQMSQQTESIATASTELHQNLETVSSSVEEMSISVGDLSRRSQEAATVAAEANQRTATAQATVRQLGEHAVQIGKVIESISDIADQTNLLALNAAIEAADAGDTGKRFAVVASEVKELARQTTDSSEEIRGRIESIQRSVEETVRAIASITEVIEKVNEVNAAIASFIEEQSITSREIARNATQATSVSTEVASNVSGVSSVISDGAAEAQKIADLAGKLNAMAVHLNETIGKFKT